MKIKEKSFTLIELIIVVIIIGILATIGLPQLNKVVEKSRRSEAINILTKMYRGYKTAIIDETLIAHGNSYRFYNINPQGQGYRSFNPDESNDQPDNPNGRSDMSWKVLGFKQNPNYDQDNLLFSYDFLKPISGWPVVDKKSTGSPSRNGNAGIRPDGYNSVNMGVAWRKIGEYEQGWDQYEVDPERWIFIDMDTGRIYKSEHYQ